MDYALEIKLKGMLWDLPVEKRDVILKMIILNPQEAFCDEKLLVRGLNSLKWYELLQILGSENLFKLLTDNVISSLFPAERRTFYKNAKELLSKYSIPAAG